MDNYQIYIDGFREFKGNLEVTLIEHGRASHSLFKLVKKLQAKHKHFGVEEEQYDMESKTKRLGIHIESTSEGLIYQSYLGKDDKEIRRGIGLHIQDILCNLKEYSYKSPFYYTYFILHGVHYIRMYTQNHESIRYTFTYYN